MRFSLTLVLVLVAAACGGSKHPLTVPKTTTVSGTIEGSTFVPKDAFTFEGAITGDNLAGTATYVQLATFPASCEQGRNNHGVPNARFLIIGLSKAIPSGETGAASATGDYDIVNHTGQTAEVLYETNDDDCFLASAGHAIDGTVTLAQTESGAGVAGYFDVTLDTSEKITGTFNAAPCVDWLTDPSAPPTCG